MFKTGFNNYACFGDKISVTVDGVTYTARLEPDNDSRPEDSDCYSPEDIKRFYADEWSYCGVVIEAERNGWTKDNLASLWGVEVNLGNNNDYLLEVANDLLAEAIQEASK